MIRRIKKSIKAKKDFYKKALLYEQKDFEDKENNDNVEGRRNVLRTRSKMKPNCS